FSYSFFFYPFCFTYADNLDVPDAVSLETAFELALSRHPQARLLDAQREVGEGRIQQAGLKPNPAFSAELENILGTGAMEGFDSTELTVGVSQVIERQEKRNKRAALVERRQDLLQWDYQEAVADLYYAVKQAFARALVAQENLVLQEELLDLARASESEVQRRAEAANASAIELSQAKLATTQQQFELNQAELRLAEARTSLASLWNAPHETDFRVSGELQLDLNLPEYSELAGSLPAAPSVARYQAESEAQRAAVELQEAEAESDFELFGGARYTREGDDAAFVMGVNIPWRIHNRNEGNIRAARAGLRVVESQRELALWKATSALANAYRNLTNSLHEWRNLDQEMLPAAEMALQETQHGYEQGIITLINVLEARRTLFSIRSRMLDAIERYL
ncbi:MAG: TolC family protein, partial [Verrucomicrobiae bacterium]|nr:TolC family protein [Verrucomicrobiae bacterium]